MKKISLLIAILSVFAFTFLTACGGNDGGETYNNIAAQSNAYSMGTQSITIKASSQNPNEPNAKFKQSIAIADIELGGALEGKKVTEVTYDTETSIIVTLDGNTKAEGGENVYGTITVKQSGMASKGSSTCTVNVLAPVIWVGTFSAGGSEGNYLVSANLSLSAGEFTDKATTENISLAGDATGELSVTLSDGVLNVKIKKCNVKNPSIVLKKEVTTFNKEYTVKLAFAASTRL